MFTLTSDQIDNIDNAFSINPTTSSNNNGNIDWTYAIDGTNISFLEENETVVAIFSVWVEDQNGERATKDITVTISGVANNAPIIALESNNSNIASIDETDSGLTTSGTLTVRDADTLDEVTASLVDTITITGTSDLSAAPNETSLKSMLSINPTDILDNTENHDQLAWSFNSNGETFNYLADGETLS